MFHVTKPNDFTFAPFREFDQNWGLLTGKCDNRFNSMTVSWGAAGILWSKPSIFVFVRPQRYTHELLEQGEVFSLSLMPEHFQKKIAVFGSKSGRTCDKYGESGLSVGEYEGVPFCNEAKTVFICKIVSQGQITDEWARDKALNDENYPNNDYHTMYIGEITAILEARKFPK